jgi:hypothetical protein
MVAACAVPAPLQIAMFAQYSPQSKCVGERAMGGREGNHNGDEVAAPPVLMVAGGVVTLSIVGIVR